METQTTQNQGIHPDWDNIWKAIKLYRTNPSFFVRHALGHLTWSKQEEILNSVRDNKYTAVRACHGSSKTFTAAEIAIWFLNCFFPAKIITTAPTHTQVKKLLWTEIQKIYKNARIPLGGECLTMEVKTDFPDHYAIGFSTDQPARAEGWHSPNILFIFDEAKGIPQWLWDSVRGSITGGNSKWLAISTTDGVQVGDNYYNIFMNKKSNWNQIHISAYESPYITGEKFKFIGLRNNDISKYYETEISPDKVNIQIANQAYIDECITEWGKDSVLFDTKVMGNISDVGADTVIKLSQVVKMFDNPQELPETPDLSDYHYGIDVARGGLNDTVFTKRLGLNVLDRKIISSKDLPVEEKIPYMCDLFEMFCDKNKHASIKVDDTGVGGGVTDTLQRREYKKVVPINFGGDAMEKLKYTDAASEMWYTLSKKIHDISCPFDNRLQTELVNRKGSQDRKGRLQIESKKEYEKRGFASPDVADSFLLAFYERKKKKAHVSTTDNAI